MRIDDPKVHVFECTACQRPIITYLLSVGVGHCGQNARFIGDMKESAAERKVDDWRTSQPKKPGELAPQPPAKKPRKKGGVRRR